VDIIFLQEVSKSALRQILMGDRIRGSWFSREGDDAAWGTQPFSMMTLLSKTRFTPFYDPSNAVLGSIWRALYPSRFDRDALCCDIFIPSFEESSVVLLLHEAQRF
jgi:tyrosyl-DNA phosphodiesterase 2